MPEIRTRLKAEAQAATEQVASAGKDHPGVADESKAQRNFTDPGSHFMLKLGNGPIGPQPPIDGGHEHRVTKTSLTGNQTSDKRTGSGGD